MPATTVQALLFDVPALLSERGAGRWRQAADRRLVSDGVATNVAQGTTRLRPQDWKSGDKLWVLDVIAPFGGADAMVADLKAKVFPERKLRVLTLKDGKREGRVV